MANEDIIRAIQEVKAAAQNRPADRSSTALDLVRTPFVMTCKTWNTAKEKKQIIFRCGPDGVTFDHPVRGATQDVKAGKVFYWWRNRNRKSHWDLPSITFEFQTGNIRPMIEKNDKVYLPEGLDNFYLYTSLLDEVKLTSSGEPNFVTITFASNIYPSIVMDGFFDPGTNFNYSEKADDSPIVKWQGKFFVHRSTPSFGTEGYSLFKSTFLDAYDKIRKAK